MGSVNVNRNVADAFYRYKMPRICAKVEGKGNGIKTVIVNMPEVAKALGRPATYPTKYFGCELGAQTQFDFKNERFIVNGSHDSAKLQDLLDGFIRKFVLCPECDNPETELIVSTKRNTISQGCKACGYHGLLDFNHKLNTFILKNPPAADPAMQGSSLTEGNRGKRSKRSGPGANSTASANGNHEGQENDAKNESDVPVTPITPNPKSSKKKAAADDDDDGTWTVDVSEAAVRARMQDLTESAKCMTVSEDNEKNEKQRMDLFYAHLKQRAASNDVSGNKAIQDILHEAESDPACVCDEETLETIQRLLLECPRHGASRQDLETVTGIKLSESSICEMLAGKNSRSWLEDFCIGVVQDAGKRNKTRLEVKSKAPLVIFEVLVRASAFAADVRKHRALLLRFTRGDARAQRSVLHALTALCQDNAALLPKVPPILKLLYDEDIVEEKAMMEWAAKPSRKYASKEVVADVRKRAQPFLDWLNDAEEDSSDEQGDSGEDIEIEYDDRAKATPIKAVATPAQPAKKAADDDDEVDVDIDAI